MADRNGAVPLDPKHQTILAFAWMAPLHVVNGVVLRYLYHRVFAPTFPDLPQHLGLAEAIGVGVFVSFLTRHATRRDEETTGTLVIMSLVLHGMFALAGLVLGWFMP